MHDDAVETGDVYRGPCIECGYEQADPDSGLCERCLFGPMDDLHYDLAAAKNVSLEVAGETLRRSVAPREEQAGRDR
jgi:hypothetical protein